MDGTMITFSLFKIFSRLTGDRPKKSHFVVKVRIESITKIEKLKVTNEDSSLHGTIIDAFTSPASVKEIKDKVRDEGVKKRLGFFYATIPKDGETKKNGVNVVEVKINTSKIQPIEGW